MTPEQELDLRMAEPEDGVVLLKVAYPDSPKTYTYVAVCIEGFWYLSGGEGRRDSWNSLVLWLKNKNAEITSLSRATSWEDIL